MVCLSTTNISELGNIKNLHPIIYHHKKVKKTFLKVKENCRTKNKNLTRDNKGYSRHSFLGAFLLTQGSNERKWLVNLKKVHIYGYRPDISQTQITLVMITNQASSRPPLPQKAKTNKRQI